MPSLSRLYTGARCCSDRHTQDLQEQEELPLSLLCRSSSTVLPLSKGAVLHKPAWSRRLGEPILDSGAGVRGNRKIF